MAVLTPTVGTPVERPAEPSTTVPYPSTVNAGDFLVLKGSVTSTSPVTLPSGWTQVTNSTAIYSTAPNIPTVFVAYKWATGSEGGTTLTVAHPNNISEWQIKAYGGVNTTTPLDITPVLIQPDAASGGSTSEALFPSVNVVTSGSALDYTVAATGSSTFTPPAGFTETMDLSTGSRPTTAGYQTNVPAGATGAVTVDLSGLGRIVGLLMVLRPAAATLTATVTGPQNVAAGATVTATVVPSGPPVTSYAWSVVSGSSTATPTLSGASTATVSLTAPAAGSLVTLQCVVSSSTGSVTVTTEVRSVIVSGEVDFLPLGGTGGTGWTNAGGAPTEGAALSDALDSTYVESPDYAGTESERRWRYQPSAPRSSLTITLRPEVTATGGTTKARLYCGTTLVQEWTITQGTSWADQALTVTTPASITDWGNLWLAVAVKS